MFAAPLLKRLAFLIDVVVDVVGRLHTFTSVVKHRVSDPQRVSRCGCAARGPVGRLPRRAQLRGLGRAGCEESELTAAAVRHLVLLKLRKRVALAHGARAEDVDSVT
jgi:hypothetical protein